MKLILEIRGCTYSVETPYDDYLSDEIKAIFSRLLMVAGFGSSVVSDDEAVIKKEDGC